MAIEVNYEPLNGRKISFVKKPMFFFVLVFLICSIIWFISTKMENQPPNVEIVLESSIIGKYHIFPVHVRDEESGIRKVVVSVVQDGLEVVLVEKELHTPLTFNRSKQKIIKLDAVLSTTDLGFTDGNVKLQVIAWDSSYKNLGQGNKICVETEIVIDTTLPKINILRHTKNISQGGSGIVVYRLSESCPKSGVVVGDNFFPGYSGHLEDSLVHIALFTVKYNQNMKTKIFVSANDYAGNKSKIGFMHKINSKVFAEDNILLSDQFLNWKMPEFSHYFENEVKDDLVDMFLKVNNEIRELNGLKVLKICSETKRKILWEGSFLPLPRSVTKAGFADDRSYIYNGEVIDHQVHLGVDLASYSASPVPSANTGQVVFSDTLGIYGNTVVIDHGFSLFSLYSHLSEIYVQEDAIVHKGEIIGRTGETGLAGGDHLHFAMVINGTHVNPMEWMDGTWVKNNITSKILF